jgi:hypothetical protein
MLDFLFHKKEEKKQDFNALVNDFYPKLKEFCKFGDIPQDRQDDLQHLVEENGYLPFPHIKALEELSAAEILFALEIKWKQNGVFDGEKFTFDNDKISVLARNNVTNSNWIKKEGHDIKLINLAGLGNGNVVEDTGKFVDWLRQLAILPSGNIKNGIFPTTMYLIPFHPREFGCAYLPTSSGVSDLLEDTFITEKFAMDAKAQVQMFIILAQLAGHPVIYDILPQTGRFAKNILANPNVARWFDITALINNSDKLLDVAGKSLEKTHDKEDVDIVKDIYKQAMKGSAGDLSEEYQQIFDEFDKELVEAKKNASREMLKFENQVKIQKRVREIVANILETKPNKKLAEEDITRQGDIIQELIKQGLWPSPGGAWCSAGVPVFDKMSDCGTYPIFKHYDCEGKDVTEFANLDCQTPYYFVKLENGKFNEDVVKFFIDEMKKLQKDYNFDGFRVDHIDHVVDKISEQNGMSISYRAPRKVLAKLNREMKASIPYFATLAEYMLWDGLFKDYHEDMGFDIFWGNDIVSQSDKTPEKIVEDNQNLESYNTQNFNIENLSILKTYNNQDGEFEAIDQYPGQLGENGALLKWFKYKFLPGGKNAQRPVLYVDGDESFTKTGIEKVIGNEISMKREKNYDFYAKFDAIDRFVKNQEIITEGEAQIIRQDEDGFAAWLISKEPCKTPFFIVANINSPTEKFTEKDENGENKKVIKEGCEVFDKKVDLPCDYYLKSEFVFDGKDYVEKVSDAKLKAYEIGTMQPAEFKIFMLAQ